MLKTIRVSLALIDPIWRRRWLWLIPLGALSAVMEMLGAAAVFLLLQLVSDPKALDSIEWLATARGWVGLKAAETTLPLIACVVALLFVGKNLLRLGEIYWRQLCTDGTGVDLMNRLLRAYLDAPYAFHLQRNSAELIRNTQIAAREVPATALHAAATAASELLIAAAVIVMLVWLTPLVSLVVVLGVVLLGALFLWTLRDLPNEWGARELELQGDELRVLQQSLGHVKEVNLYDRAARFAERHRATSSQIMRIKVLLGMFVWIPRLGVETVFVIGVAAMVVANNVAASEPVRLAPTIGIFAYAALRLLPSFHLIVVHLNRVQQVRAAVDEVHRDFAILDRLREEREARHDASAPCVLQRDLVLDGVWFAYEGSDSAALQRIDLTIRKGESIGIVGPTGSGKSTLINLILGLLEPTRGQILVDGRDIRSNIRGWQRQLGYVPQEVSLLDTTVRGNIAFALDPQDIDARRVEEVGRAAQLASLVERLPSGLDTVVGERGIRLSGGERQRVLVARALYRDPEVLIFDEATAALDSETERALGETIARLRGSRTMIAIAHRLSTVRHCDRLVLLDRGEVVANGTFEELLASNDTFRRLAAAASQL